MTEYEQYMKAFDDVSMIMMKAKGYKTVDDFTQADVEELTRGGGNL